MESSVSKRLLQTNDIVSRLMIYIIFLFFFPLKQCTAEDKRLKLISQFNRFSFVSSFRCDGTRSETIGDRLWYFAYLSISTCSRTKAAGDTPIVSQSNIIIESCCFLFILWNIVCSVECFQCASATIILRIEVPPWHLLCRQRFVAWLVAFSRFKIKNQYILHAIEHVECWKFWPIISNFFFTSFFRCIYLFKRLLREMWARKNWKLPALFTKIIR